MTADELAECLDMGSRGAARSTRSHEAGAARRGTRSPPVTGGSRMSEEVTAEIRTTHILDLAAGGKRLDGRGADEVPEDHDRARVRHDRPTARRSSASATRRCSRASSSSPGKPFPDTPNAGVLTTNAEADPALEPDVRAWSPAARGDRGLAGRRPRDPRGRDDRPDPPLRHSRGEVLDLFHVTSTSSTTRATSSTLRCLAAVSALAHATVPAKRFGIAEADYPLEVQHLPIECTFVRLGDTIVVDPTFDEEQAAQGRLTVATDETGRIVAMQKGLVGAFSPDDVKAIVGARSSTATACAQLAKGGGREQAHEEGRLDRLDGSALRDPDPPAGPRDRPGPVEGLGLSPVLDRDAPPGRERDLRVPPLRHALRLQRVRLPGATADHARREGSGGR